MPSHAPASSAADHPATGARSALDTASRFLVDNMAEGALTVGGSRIILFANRRLAELLQVPAEDLPGTVLDRWVVPDARDRLDLLLCAAAAGPRRAEVALLTATGQRRNVRLSVQAAPAHGAEARYCIVVCDLGGLPGGRGADHDTLVSAIGEQQHAVPAARTYIERIEKMVFGTVNAISTMVELRDPYTSGHEKRVGEFAAAIAAEMGLAETVQRGLRLAGAVHDVGKLAIPVEILAKPGRLSRIEYDYIKTHAAQGYEMLKAIESPWPLAEVARQHHERMDAGGYPRGLAGDGILLEARILAVADVVESMASNRPYRATLGLEAALAEIRRGRDRLYDGQVVDACLSLIDGKGYRLPV